MIGKAGLIFTLLVIIGFVLGQAIEPFIIGVFVQVKLGIFTVVWYIKTLRDE